MPVNLESYYNYLKEAGADTPPTLESFTKTLSDSTNARTYYDYLRSNKFDTPETFESFSNTLGIKKKDFGAELPAVPSASSFESVSPEPPKAPSLDPIEISGRYSKISNSTAYLNSLVDSRKQADPKFASNVSKFIADANELNNKGLLSERTSLAYDFFSRNADIETNDDTRDAFINSIYSGAFYSQSPQLKAEYDASEFKDILTPRQYSAFKSLSYGRQSQYGEIQRKLKDKSFDPIDLEYAKVTLDKIGSEIDQNAAALMLNQGKDKSVFESLYLDAKNNIQSAQDRERQLDYENPYSLKSFSNVLSGAVNRGMAMGTTADILNVTADVSGIDYERLARVQADMQNARASKAYEAFSENPSFENFKKNPMGIMAELSLESLVALYSHGVKRIGAGVLTGAAVGSVVPGVGTAMGAGSGVISGLGLSSLNLEYSSSMMEELSNMGVDVTDAEQLRNAFANKETVDKLKESGLKKGIPIALFDMVSAGIAGKIAARPAKTMLGRTALAVGEVAAQAAAGAAGEAAGQLVQRGEVYSPNAVLMEAIGEFGPGSVEIAYGTMVEAAKKGKPISKRDAVSVASQMKPEDVKENLSTQVASGNMTQAQAEVIGKEVASVSSVLPKVPEELSVDAKAKVVDLIGEKNKLTQKLQSIDDALKPEIQQKIDDINNQIVQTVKTDQDATQESRQEQGVVPEGGVVQPERVEEGQREVREGEGGRREGEVPQADVGDRAVGGERGVEEVRSEISGIETQRDAEIAAIQAEPITDQEKQQRVADATQRFEAQLEPLRAEAAAITTRELQGELAPQTAIDRVLNEAIPMASQSLKPFGTEFVVLENDEEAAKVPGIGQNQAIFKGDDNKVYINKSRLADEIEAGIVVWHEAAHPVMNTLMNTDRPAYDRAVRGFQAAAQRDPNLKNVFDWANTNYSAEAISQREGRPVSEEEAMQIRMGEGLVETVGRVNEGLIDINKLDAGFRQVLIDFINKVAEFIGMKPILKDTDLATFKRTVSKVADALKSGRDISEVVGAENVGMFQAPTVQLRAELQTDENPVFFEQAKEFANRSSFANKIEFKGAIQKMLKSYIPTLKKLYGKSFDPSIYNEQTFKYLSDTLTKESVNAIMAHPEAIGWYDEKTQSALAAISAIHPEIETDAEMRGVFIAALAIMSNGNKVDKNFDYAEQQYRTFKNTGRFNPDGEYGAQQAGIKKSLQLLNGMLDSGLTMSDINNFLTSKYRAGDLKYRKADGKIGNLVSGELADEQVFGAVVLGPKIGNGFYMNLWGEFGQLTMDRWFMRTWGRLTGTLIEKDPKKLAGAKKRMISARDAIRLGTPEYKTLSSIVGSVSKLSPIRLAESVQKASADKTLRSQLQSTPALDELRKAANSFAKLESGEKEAPANGNERRFIRQVFEDVKSRLSSEHGIDITMADLQAVLWYPEKILYESFKADQSFEDASSGYTEDSAPDYFNAAKKLSLKLGATNESINQAVSERRRLSGVDSGARRQLGGAVFGRTGEEVISTISDIKRMEEAGRQPAVQASVGNRQAIIDQAKAAGTYLKAPNGKPTKLTEDQWTTVRTPEFKNWFGDWENDPENASKVVDENGEPMVVYHGSGKEFDTFFAGKAEGWGEGMYFASDIADTAEFGDVVYPVFLNIRRPITDQNINDIEDDVVRTMAWEEESKRRNSWDEDENASFLNYQDELQENVNLANKAWRELGYDGIKFFGSNNINGFEIVTFKPTQIKSATANIGAFSPTDARIQMSVGNRQMVIDKAKSDGTYLKAPNGKKTKLNEDQWVTVRTLDFKNWFGDWEKGESSKSVLDDNGEPRVFYHGSPYDFEAFQPGEPIYLTSNKSVADEYRNMGGWRQRIPGGRVYDVFVRGGDMLEIDAMGTRNNNLKVPGREWKATSFGNVPEGAITLSDYVNENIEGRDGVMIRNVVDTKFTDSRFKSDVIAVAEPIQVKSASENIGAFSTEDIRMQASVGNRQLIDQTALALQNSIVDNNPFKGRVFRGVGERVNVTYGGRTDEGLGDFYTDNKIMAGWFAGTMEFDLDKGDYAKTGRPGKVSESILEIRNPYTIDENDPDYNEDSEYDSWQIFMNRMNAKTKENVQDFVTRLISKGHDGIALKGNTTNYYASGTYDIYVKFKPDQFTDAAEAYVKAKADGTNPELVSAIESRVGDIQASAGGRVENDTNFKLAAFVMRKKDEGASTVELVTSIASVMPGMSPQDIQSLINDPEAWMKSKFPGMTPEQHDNLIATAKRQNIYRGRKFGKPIDPAYHGLHVPDDMVEEYTKRNRRRDNAAKELFDKVFSKAYFTSSKGMPDWFLLIKDLAIGVKNIEIARAANTIEKLKKVAKSIGFSDWDTFSKALKDAYGTAPMGAPGLPMPVAAPGMPPLPMAPVTVPPSIAALPTEIIPFVYAMRGQIDNLTRDLIGFGYVTPEQAITLQQNIGAYVNRSYRMFTEKGYEPKKEVYDAAIKYFVDQKLKEIATDKAGTITLEQAQQEALAEAQKLVDAYLNRKTNPYFRPTEIDKRNPGILKQRQDIPEPIRRLMGEETDPGIVFMMTVSKQAALKASSQYLSEMRKNGMGTIFFEKDDPKRPLTHNIEVASIGSETLSPLGGLYTTQQVYDALMAMEPTYNEFTRVWMKAVGAVRYGKTILSVATQMKNFLSNTGFALMNGMFFTGVAGKAFMDSGKYGWGQFTGGEITDIVDKAIRLNLVGQALGARELAEMLGSGDVHEIALDIALGPEGRWGKRVMKRMNPLRFAEKTYRIGDEFWKVYGYLNERHLLAMGRFGGAYNTLTIEQQDQIDIEASERVKNTWPTYDRVIEAAKYVSKSAPVFGNFISFPAESIRVLTNTVKIAIQDIKDPQMMESGVRRMIGIATYVSARTAITIAVAKVFGFAASGILGAVLGDDEEERRKSAIKEALPPFMRTGDLFIKPGDAPHKFTVINMSDLDPYGIIPKASNALTEGREGIFGRTMRPGVMATIAEFFSPFLEPEMTFNVMWAIQFGVDPQTGEKIVSDTDSTKEAFLKSTAFVWKQLKPSTLAIFERINKGGSKSVEATAMFGARPYEVDLHKAWDFVLSRMGRDMEDVALEYNRIQSNTTMTDQQKVDAKIRAEEKKTVIVNKYHEIYKNFILTGANQAILDEKLDSRLAVKLTGFDKKTKEAVKTNVFDGEFFKTRKPKVEEGGPVIYQEEKPAEYKPE